MKKNMKRFVTVIFVILCFFMPQHSQGMDFRAHEKTEITTVVEIMIPSIKDALEVYRSLKNAFIDDHYSEDFLEKLRKYQDSLTIRSSKLAKHKLYDSESELLIKEVSKILQEHDTLLSNIDPLQNSKGYRGILQEKTKAWMQRVRESDLPSLIRYEAIVYIYRYIKYMDVNGSINDYRQSEGYEIRKPLEDEVLSKGPRLYEDDLAYGKSKEEPYRNYEYHYQNHPDTQDLGNLGTKWVIIHNPLPTEYGLSKEEPY